MHELTFQECSLCT